MRLCPSYLVEGGGPRRLRGEEHGASAACATTAVSRCHTASCPARWISA